MLKKLPIGYDDFKEVASGKYYYVDKTLFIKTLLDDGAKVNLFTRPRRFGKSLNISMLRYYFERPLDGTSNRQLFENKKIFQAGEEYLAYEEQYPVIHLSLKSAKQPTWEMAYKMLIRQIAEEFKRHCNIIKDGKLEESDILRFRNIMSESAEQIDYSDSLRFLSQCLAGCYDKKAVILVDEYDVPLENAYFEGFYNEMVQFMRSWMESAFKTNISLEFAVITGCLRISKESIFTGLNNLKINSIMEKAYGEYYGFTQSELDEILAYYNLKDKRELIREWYDGYLFGKNEVYNPWSVVNFVTDTLKESDAFPVEYWSNTSSNSIVKELIAYASLDVKEEIEHLICGGVIEKKLHEDITYAEIHDNPENLWNFLYFTGYLKAVEIKAEGNGRVARLSIPNIEVLKIYQEHIIKWTQETIKKKDLSALYAAFLAGKEEAIEKELAPLLVASISYLDSKEDFYHGFILGLLMNIEGYYILSNREAGDGRFDISIERADGFGIPVIIEFKVAGRRNEMLSKAEEALSQIAQKRYDMQFQENGYESCIHVGIGFYRKMCRVKCEVIEFDKIEEI